MTREPIRLHQDGDGSMGRIGPDESSYACTHLALPAAEFEALVGLLGELRDAAMASYEEAEWRAMDEAEEAGMGRWAYARLLSKSALVLRAVVSMVDSATAEPKPSE